MTNQQNWPALKSEDSVTGYIYKTLDYSKFTLGENNRDIRSANVKSKKESIKKFGILNPIVVNERFEVREGNHRLLAMKELEKEGYSPLPPIFYIVKTTNESEMIAMNNTNFNWLNKDYVNHFANRNFIEYKKIIKLSEKHNIDVSDIINVLNGAYVNSQKRKNDFKYGKFALSSSQWSQFESFLVHFQELTPYITQNRGTKIALFGIFTHKKYNQKTMFNKIFNEYSKTNRPVNLAGTTDQCKVKWLNVYNHKAQSNKIDYFISSNGKCELIY